MMFDFCNIMNAYFPGKTVYQQYYTFIMMRMITKKPDTTSQEMSTEYNSSGTLAMLLCPDLNFQMIKKKILTIYKYFKWLFR
jgi:hypothetical protein